MDIHPIRNDEDHARALRQIDGLWGAEPGTPEADALEVLVTLVDDYEARRHAVEPPDSGSSTSPLGCHSPSAAAVTT